jgi:hypothetical protein
MKTRALFFVALVLLLTQTSFGGTVSSCANLGLPYTAGNGDVYTRFTCSLYNDASSYTISLTPFMSQNGTDPSNNWVGAGYLVVINGDPGSLPDNSNPGGLLNQSLWQTVLFFTGDQDVNTFSDSLTVDWAGAFPSASTILSYDQNLYGPVDDSAFFIPSTGTETVYATTAADGNTNQYYDIYIPEPGTLVLLGTSLALLSGMVLKRRRTA